MKTKVEISDKSVETAGLPTDYTEAICEYVWNSFDAKATEVNIEFDAKNALANLVEFTISDNGEGISYKQLDLTFGKFLDSQKKKDHQRTSYIHGKRGKGRYSFEAFCGRATWSTTYYDEEERCFVDYPISIDADSKDYYEKPDKTKLIKKAKGVTGTKVVFELLKSLSSNELKSELFVNALCKEFGWYLHLNQSRKIKLLINGVAIPYKKLIAESAQDKFSYKDSLKKTHSFVINYVRWYTKIGDKYYFYFMDSDQTEHAKRLTSFNNKNDDFHHSVYVESDYFLNFSFNEENDSQSPLLGKNQTDETYKALYKHLIDFLEKKRKGFLRGNSDKVISRLQGEGVMPDFKDNKYDQLRRSDFNEVVKEIYLAEPKILLDLGKEQKKTMLGMLNLVLDSEERENVIKIIDEVVKLSKEEREQLVKVLRKTSLSRVIDALKLIERRYTVIEALKLLVHDLQKFSTERDNIQKVVEENYWLFGEEYHLVSADRTFEKALAEYLYLVDGVTKKDNIKNPSKNRRPDIFMCRKRVVPGGHGADSQIEESVIVELKTPKIKLTTKEFRQVQDYLNVIVSLPKYNSQTRLWKFYLVSNEYDDTIAQQHRAFKDKGKRYLVYETDKYEIYAMTWDDVFRNFEIRHSYLLEKLEFDRDALQTALKEEGVELNKGLSDRLTELAVEERSS